jgi:hypothetical protein
MCPTEQRKYAMGATSFLESDRCQQRIGVSVPDSQKWQGG